MAKPAKNAISPTREEDYPEWYQQVVRAPIWPSFRQCAAAWSSSRGAMPFGRTCSGCSTGCSRTPGTRTPIFRCSFRCRYSGERGRARRRVRQGMRRGHASPAGSGAQRRQADSDRASWKSRWSCGPPARRSSARCMPSGCSRIAICRYSSISGPTSCAGKCARGCFCARPSSSGRKGTRPTPRARRREEETMQDARMCMPRSPRITWRCR